MTKEQTVEKLNSYINHIENCGNIKSKHYKAVKTALNLIQTQQEEINKALEIAFQYGQIDGDHHKLWVIDQIVRNLTGNDYKEWVNHYEYDEETGEDYTWDKGIAP